MTTSMYKPFFQIICVGLKTNTIKPQSLGLYTTVKHNIHGFNSTGVLVKTVCSKQAAEKYIQSLRSMPLDSLVQYTIVERPRTSPFELCDECPSRQQKPAANYY